MTTPAQDALVKAAREVDEMMRKEISHCTRYGRATEEDLDVYRRFTRLTQCIQALDAEHGATVSSARDIRKNLGWRDLAEDERRANLAANGLGREQGAEVEDGWISIKDRMPEKGTFNLWWLAGQHACAIISDHSGGYLATHWMPLPAAPSAGGEA